MAIAPTKEIDEAWFDKWLAATKIDRECTNEIFDAQKRALPFLDRHLRSVVFQPPVFTVTAFYIALFVDQPVKGHRFRCVISRTQINLFRGSILRVLPGQLAQSGQFHVYAPNAGSAQKIKINYCSYNPLLTE